MSEPKNILMIKSHSMGVGDLLRSSAAWRALHNRFPGVRLHLLFLSKHAGYPTEELMRDHHLLASAHFVTIREGDPGQAKAKRRPLAQITREVERVATEVRADLVIDFESNGTRTSWLTRKAAKASQAQADDIMIQALLSGQISEDHMQELMLRDPDFLEWMLDVASATEAA